MALLVDDKLITKMQRCEVTSWGMNPAAIFATALFTPYWSCAEYALCFHKIKNGLLHQYIEQKLWTLSVLFLLPDRIHRYLINQ
jgi:hypothetical protein